MLISFLCCQCQDSFPRWEEGVCMVQCTLLPKLLVECESCPCEVPFLGQWEVPAVLELVQVLSNGSQYL